MYMYMNHIHLYNSIHVHDYTCIDTVLHMDRGYPPVSYKAVEKIVRIESRAIEDIIEVHWSKGPIFLLSRTVRNQNDGTAKCVCVCVCV